MHLPSKKLLPVSALALGLALLVSCSEASSKTPTTITAPTAAASSVDSQPDAKTDTAAVVAATKNQAQANIPPAVFAENNIAIRGADPVAYFKQGQYVAGNTNYTHEWAGATWQFSSAANRDLFANNPAEYAPQYGGFCAWAVSQGYTASVDPTAWKIVDGKLYLNYDARIQRRWQQDIAGNIARGNRNWPGVLN
ncbi:MAG: YHS domain-containing (seleno)protein [Cyanobacteria bacterium P01_D01_bin.105]